METWKVTASDIKTWTESNKRRSEEILPLLLRKLIVASVVPDEIDMPSGDSINTPGLDGRVLNSERHTFVPMGRSFWEMGTDKYVIGKAEKEYVNRTSQTILDERKKITFVFVTTRQWNKKTDWSIQKTQENEWKDVKAYDANHLEAWLDTCPSVHIWFANELGKRCENVFDCEQAWVTWSTVTTPAISKELLLCSRQDICKNIDKTLKAKPQIVKIVGDSILECFGFSLAYFMSHPEYRDRVLIIESQSAWNSLASIIGNLILIPNLKCIPDNMNLAIQNGHWVVLPQCQAEFGSENAFALSRIPKEETTPMLVSMGLNMQDAWDIVSETNGALMPMMRNKRLNNGVSIIPNWLNDEKLVKCALAVLLMGKWDVAYSGDKEIACRLTGKESYESIEEDLHILSQCNDFPCRKRNGKWLAISRLDLWHLLGSRVSTILFDKYADCIKSVLSDFRIASNQEQKILSQLLGNRDRLSDTLEKGLIELLPIISAYSNVCRNYGDYSPKSRVKVLLREVFESSDTAEKWHRIGPYLSLLAEASPDSFLNAVETDLNQKTPFALALFQREGSGLFGGCFHSNLLWGLEIVSWNLKHFSRVVLILVKLSALDPGGNYRNRPINTLNEIFCSWLPQTHASVEQRIEVLRSLRNRYPDVLWNMLTSILDHKQFFHPIASPKYENWKKGYREGTTNGEFYAYRLSAFDLLVYEIELCFSNEKLQFVLKILSDLPKDRQTNVLDVLEKIIKNMKKDDSVPLNVKREIALTLENECNEDHFRRANGEGPGYNVLHGLSELITTLLENDLVGSQLYVFSSDYSWSLTRREKNYDETKQLLLEKKKLAVDTLITQGSFEHIVDLSSSIADSRIVGFLIAEYQNLEYVEHLISYAISDEARHSCLLLSGAIGVLLSRGSIVEEIFSRGLSTWSAEQFKRFLSVLPFYPRTYEMIQQLPSEIEREYWTYFEPCFFNIEDAELAKLALYKLLEVSRQHTAIEQACFFLHKNGRLDSDTLATLLEYYAFKKTNEEPSKYSNHNILEIFKHLHADCNLPEERVLKLEFAYMSFFREDEANGHKIPPTLWRKIKSDPSFFVELMSYAFSADPEIEDEFPEFSENMKTYCSKQAHEVLFHIGLLPFDFSSNHEESFQHAMSWITAVQQNSQKINRQGITNHILGKILSASPIGEDGIWPHEVIRYVIESISSKSFDSGFSSGYYNRKFGRLVQVSREIDLGDQKEANQLRENAKRLTISSPKTAGLLNNIADSYDGRPSLSIDDFI